MPSLSLCTVSPQDIRDYIKCLMDRLVRGGSYIFDGDGGILDKVKPQNIKAMIDAII